MPLSRLKSLMLLSECTGDEIWSLEHCRARGVPSAWIAELADGFESGFSRDSQTIYFEDRVLNQYEGIRDVDLAQALGRELGLDVETLVDQAVSRTHLVRLIQEVAEEG
ncbi:hypothetical protein [Aureliella helgolandensis]|uniref:Uncharacterized protein n=1 Tax=Aureliella helgolandensis TaxID=2527968 RepID=A0A518GHA0_9BACT|nr:hypothetical protein [Aureliella helgolandensis]QDV27966.1 hypothetical protein Q31a_63590 [Aureliella helgolandensis]